MRRLLVLLFVPAVLLPAGCSEEPAKPQPEPELEIVSLDRVVHTSANFELTLELFRATQGPAQWKYMEAELRNLTDRTVRYAVGSAGCPARLLATYDAEGHSCVGVRPLAPCESGSDRADLEPHGTLRAGSLVMSCGSRERHGMMFHIHYTLLPEGEAGWQDFTVEYPLEDVAEAPVGSGRRLSPW